VDYLWSSTRLATLWPVLRPCTLARPDQSESWEALLPLFYAKEQLRNRSNEFTAAPRRAQTSEVEAWQLRGRQSSLTHTITVLVYCIAWYDNRHSWNGNSVPSSPLIDTNRFYETSSINELNFNICFAFHFRAHNFTNSVYEVAKCD
jgi:hypothetical protein